MLETLLTFETLDLAALFGLLGARAWGKDRKLLCQPLRQARRLPVVDKQLRNLAGPSSSSTRRIQQTLLRTLRMLVNTRAFEYLVLMIVNPKSKFRRQAAQKRSKSWSSPRQATRLRLPV